MGKYKEWLLKTTGTKKYSPAVIVVMMVLIGAISFGIGALFYTGAKAESIATENTNNLVEVTDIVEMLWRCRVLGRDILLQEDSNIREQWYNEYLDYYKELDKMMDNYHSKLSGKSADDFAELIQQENIYRDGMLDSANLKHLEGKDQEALAALRDVTPIAIVFFEHMSEYVQEQKTNILNITHQNRVTAQVIGVIFAAICAFGALMIFITMQMMREQMELAKKADAAKSNFLANMSHEIRTPMNSILGMAEIILREDTSDTVTENTYTIKRSADVLLSIINDILDFSKIESGKMDLVEMPYWMPTIINDVSNITLLKIGHKPVEFILEADANIPNQLTGDEVRIRQVLVNLLSNAAKFTHDGFVKLKLWCEPTDTNGVVILNASISDSGIGMKPEDLSSLYSDFVRLDTTKNREIEGTGLGLPITKRLITLMGGEIEVESVYGQGTTFTVRLSQKVADENPIAKINHDGLMSVVLHDSEYQSAALEYAFENLGTQYQLFNTEKDFVNDLSEKNYTHIFIELAVYRSIGETIKENAPDSKIVIILDKNENIKLKKSELALYKPIYSLAIASVLNNEKHSQHYLQKKVGTTHDFIAPEAHVLVVDDNSVNLKVAEGLLNPYKLKVSTAISGIDCLALIQKTQYDIIFMDHMMPVMDGVETVRHIRAEGGEYGKNVTIVALTANAISGMREMFLAESFNGFLAKPIELQKLDEVLREFLPQNLIIPLDVPADDEEETERNKRQEVEKIEKESRINIPGLDMHLAIGNNINVDNLLSVLEVVYADGDKKIEKMEQNINDRDLGAYMMEVHALKSVAAGIGATALSKLALEHETAARENNFSLIEEGFEGLVDNYRILLKNIKPYVACAERQVEEESLIHMNERSIFEKLSEISALAEEYDKDNAIFIIDELLGARIEPSLRDKLLQAKADLQVYEYDRAIALAQAAPN